MFSLRLEKIFGITSDSHFPWRKHIFSDQFCFSWLSLVLCFEKDSFASLQSVSCSESLSTTFMWIIHRFWPADSCFLLGFRNVPLYSFFLHYIFSSYSPSEDTCHRHCSLVNYSNAEFNLVVCIHTLTISLLHFQTDKPTIQKNPKTKTNKHSVQKYMTWNWEFLNVYFLLSFTLLLTRCFKVITTWLF